MTSTPPKVFISYSHDSSEHAERVWALSDRLRADGVDCTIDQYEPAPPEGWPQWMDRQVEEADFVLVVCTATYLLRASGKERPGVGRGVRFESVLIVQALYDAAMRNEVSLAGRPRALSLGIWAFSLRSQQNGNNFSIPGSSGCALSTLVSTSFRFC